MKILSKFTIIFWCSFFISCSGQSLISLPETNLSNLKSLSVKATQYGSPDTDEVFPHYLQDDGSKEFISNLGFTITLQQASISWEHLHLVSDGSDEECEIGFDVQVDIERAQNLLANDLDLLQLTTIQISDHAYCRYEIHLSPNNETFSGINDQLTLLNNSLILSGKWHRDTESGSFSASIPDEIVIDGTFKSGTFFESADHPIHYHEGQTEKTIIFGLAYDKLFSDFDFSDASASLEDILQENIKDSLSQFLATTNSH